MKERVKRGKTMRKFYILICLFAIVSCGGGGGGGGGNEPVVVPEIQGVFFFEWFSGDPIPPDGFFIGQQVELVVCVINPNYDTTTLSVDQYWLSGPNPTVPYYQLSEPLPEIPKVPENEEVCYFKLEPFRVDGPVGNWKEVFSVFNSKGYESPDFVVYLTVK